MGRFSFNAAKFPLRAIFKGVIICVMENLDKVLALKAKVENEYKRRIKTIDDFIALYKELDGESIGVEQKQEAASGTISNATDDSTPPQTTPNPPKRLTGLRQVGVSVFGDVSDKFTKFDVRDAIERARPETQGKITRDALDGVVDELTRREMAVMIVANSGRKPAIYRKVLQASSGLNFSLEQVSANTEKGLEDITSINQAVTN